MKRTGEHEIHLLTCEEEIEMLDVVGGAPGTFQEVLRELLERVRRGVERPSSFEREWLCQVFGFQWTYPRGAPPSRREGVVMLPWNDEIRWILGRPNFYCGDFAQALRDGGHEIPTKAEEEQAYVIHWMLTLYQQHGDNWREIGSAELATYAKDIERWERRFESA